MRPMISILALSALCSTACAQVGSLSQAEVEQFSGVTDPASAVKEADDGWLAFGLPAIEGTKSPCCWSGRWNVGGEIGCSLEKDFQSYGTRSDSPQEDTIIAYTLVRDGQVTRLKVAGKQCPMDAEGQKVTWIPVTDSQETLDWLELLARRGEDDVSHLALWAMSLHASAKASDHLHAMARDKSGDLAEEAIFWLGEARGQAGYEVLEDLLDELPKGDTRRHINFALTQNSSDDAIELLSDIARNDQDPEQRGDALFWMAQEHPVEAQDLIVEVIATEHDQETLERAVFAMSQLPPETSGPMLLELARDENAPREARRQALFWLANSDDEESVAALTELLTR